MLAHSMGNRAVVRALERIEPQQLPAGGATLHHLFFAAADVARGVFRNLVGTLASRARRLTLYASKNDKALLASHLLPGYPRAGDAGKHLLVVSGMDTVDASTAETSLFALGHSVFASKRSIINDIFVLLGFDLAPERRLAVAVFANRSHFIPCGTMSSPGLSRVDD